jgi:hypothetical protein
MGNEQLQMGRHCPNAFERTNGLKLDQVLGFASRHTWLASSYGDCGVSDSRLSSSVSRFS